MLESMRVLPNEDRETIFSYRAVCGDGRTERGEVRARDRSAALVVIASRGLFPIEIGVRADSSRTSSGVISAADLAVGLRILATLLDSGLPIRRISKAFGALAPKSWASTVATLQPALRDGRSLSAAFDESPARLPSVIVGIVRAGEASGAVPGALRAAAEMSESSAATMSAIRAALAYPAVLALAGGASIAILATVVLPRFATILEDLGQKLPPSTRMVLGFTSLVSRWGPLALLLASVACGLFRWRVSRQAGRTTVHAILLRIPVIGPVRHAASTSRACAAMAALLDAGISMPSALLHSASAAGDAAVSARVLVARECVIAGRALWTALEETAAFTTASLRLIRAGEETGSLRVMLAHASKLERERAMDGVRRLVRLLEPALILLFAGVVAFVAASLLQAIYSVHPV